ncbi:MAG: 2-phospho-L-lactate transferase [Porticoccaceae bacterium]
MTAPVERRRAQSPRKVMALCGGVGGAKLALGLAQLLPADELILVVNTGDDFDHLGLRICPDLDTISYTLAGCVNPATSWGRANETRVVMSTLASLGSEDWFFLGDRDIALHIERTHRLAAGQTLSEVTRELASKLGVTVTLVPMSDDRVATEVETADGPLAFQHYFVREQCRPRVTGFRFVGAERARPHPQLINRLSDDSLDLVILCPSNPFVSIDPILALPGVRSALRRTPTPVIAVSPIVGGTAVKGPTAKMMVELGHEVSSLTVARHYQDFLDGFILDQRDQLEIDEIEKIISEVRVAQTLMLSLDDRVALAREALFFGETCRKRERDNTL